jgi:hypothetical protein
MSSVTAAAAVLNDGPDCTQDTWHDFCIHLKMFFRAAGLTGIISGDKPIDSKQLAAWDIANSQAVAFIWRKVDRQYRYLVNDCDGADAAYAALAAHFNKPTLFARMAARQRLYTCAQASDEPIDKYIQRVTACVDALASLKVTISDSEIVDVLLMGVDDSFYGTRTQLFTAAKEPSLDDVKTALRAAGNALAPSGFKIEGALATRTSGTRATASRVDSHGNTWCDTSSDGCHRCGRSGHRAPRCMLDMPQSVREWIRENIDSSRHESARPAVIDHVESAGAAFATEGPDREGIRIMQLI